MQTYDAAEVALVLQWVDKYFTVNALINKVFGNDDLENDPSMSSFGNEIEYQRLKFWFRKNHDKFVPIWVDFCASHGYSIEFNGDQMEYRNNPFLFYYDHDNLLDLADTMGVTMPADTQDTNKQFMELILNTMNRFSCTAIHLAWWIGEFADTSVQFP